MRMLRDPSEILHVREVREIVGETVGGSDAHHEAL